MHGNACCCRPSQLRCCACATTAVRSRHCSQLTAAHSSSQQLGASSQTDAESIGQLPEHGRAFAGRSPGRPSMDGATAASASSAKKARTVPPSPAQTLSAAHTLPPRDPTPVHEKFEPTKVRLLCAVPTAVPNCCARPLFVHCCVRPLLCPSTGATVIHSLLCPYPQLLAAAAAAAASERTRIPDVPVACPTRWP